MKTVKAKLNLNEAADMIGVPRWYMWRLVHVLGVLPKPNIPNRTGRRFVYDVKDISQMAATYKQAMADGTIQINKKRK
jgi:hypothetical protein